MIPISLTEQTELINKSWNFFSQNNDFIMNSTTNSQQISSVIPTSLNSDANNRSNTTEPNKNLRFEQSKVKITRLIYFFN